jgi:hypothetical protein
MVFAKWSIHFFVDDRVKKINFYTGNAMNSISRFTLRAWLIRWLYAVAVVHLIVGALLPWIGGAAIFDDYHRSVEAAFWTGPAPLGARAQQLWWVALFGATVQSLSLWMFALIHLGDQLKRAAPWGWLIAGIVIWAPQDMWISWGAQVWTHIWVDGLALLTLLPPLVWLYLHDARTIENNLSGDSHA